MDEITLTFKPSEVTANGPEETEDTLPGQVYVVLSAKAIAALQKWAALADRVYDETNSDLLTHGTFSYMKFCADSLIEVKSVRETSRRKEILMFPHGSCYLQFTFGKYHRYWSETTYEVSIPIMSLTSQGNQTDADNEH